MHVLHVTAAHLKMALVYRVNPNFCPLLNSLYCKCRVNIRRFKSLKQPSEKRNRNADTELKEEHNKCRSFRDIINFRRDQASKSILVQIDSIHSVASCEDYCTYFGKINNMYHYTTCQDHENFVLVEFESTNSIKQILRVSARMNNPEFIPVPTTILLFRNALNSRQNKSVRVQRKNSSESVNFNSPNDNLIRNSLQPIQCLIEQMETLHTILKVPDFDIRLRFYTAYQLELCFSQLFPTFSVLPFGSSVTGFGQKGCDLDLVCLFNTPNSREENKKSKLVLHSKPYSCIYRENQQELLITLSHIMQKFVPGISNMKRILMARVPIIKFTNKYTNMQCDISSTNMIALYMSELLFTYGEIDPRVKPLVCTIREWAKHNNLTNETPGTWITNFSLTLLIMFYLQRMSILPSLNRLKSLKRSESHFQSFSHPVLIRHFRNETALKENMPLPSLLHGFFKFYATFNFRTDAICIQEGKIKKKLNDSPVYIYNPFEPLLNVSKNITATQLTRIVEQCRRALYIMEKPESHVLLSLLRLTSTTPARQTTSTDVSHKEDISNKQHNDKVDVTSENSELNNKECLTQETSLEESNGIKEIIK